MDAEAADECLGALDYDQSGAALSPRKPRRECLRAFRLSLPSDSRSSRSSPLASFARRGRTGGPREGAGRRETTATAGLRSFQRTPASPRRRRDPDAGRPLGGRLWGFALPRFGCPRFRRRDLTQQRSYYRLKDFCSSSRMLGSACSRCSTGSHEISHIDQGIDQKNPKVLSAGRPQRSLHSFADVPL